MLKTHTHKHTMTYTHLRGTLAALCQPDAIIHLSIERANKATTQKTEPAQINGRQASCRCQGDMSNMIATILFIHTRVYNHALKKD